MDTVVFTDPEVIRFFSDEMILVKINIDTSTELTKAYGVTGFPTFVVLSGLGKEVDRTYGYHAAAELTGRLREINRGENLFVDLVAGNRQTADRALMLRIAEGYRVRGLVPEAEGWYRRAIESGSRTDSVTIDGRLNLGYMYFLIKDWDRLQPEFRQFLADYPDHIYAADIMMMLANSHFQQHEFDEAGALYRTLIERFPKGESYVKTARERLKEMDSSTAD